MAEQHGGTPERPDPMKDALDLGREQVDKHIDRGFQAWFKEQSEERKLAVSGVIGAALVGVVGLPIVSAIKAARTPTLDSETVLAVFWLALLTLPLFAFCGVLAWGLGRASWGLLSLAILAAYAGGWILGQSTIPAELGEYYCYVAFAPDGTLVYENACRVFDSNGFLSDVEGAGGSPSRAAEVFGFAFAYVAEARGMVMALCGIVGGLSAGYLLRPQTS